MSIGGSINPVGRMICSTTTPCALASSYGPGGAAGQMAGVVLDAVAVADLPDHLEVEHRPLVQPLRLEELPLRLQLAAIPGELGLDRFDGAARALARRDEVRFRIDRNLVVP